MEYIIDHLEKGEYGREGVTELLAAEVRKQTDTEISEISRSNTR